MSAADGTCAICRVAAHSNTRQHHVAVTRTSIVLVLVMVLFALVFHHGISPLLCVPIFGWRLPHGMSVVRQP
jgi:hypothetical protein